MIISTYGIVAPIRTYPSIPHRPFNAIWCGKPNADRVHIWTIRIEQIVVERAVRGKERNAGAVKVSIYDRRY